MAPLPPPEIWNVFGQFFGWSDDLFDGPSTSSKAVLLTPFDTRQAQQIPVLLICCQKDTNCKLLISLDFIYDHRVVGLIVLRNSPNRCPSIGSFSSSPRSS